MALGQSSILVDKTGGKVLDSSCFIGFGTLRGLGSTAGILRRFHGAFPLSWRPESAVVQLCRACDRFETPGI